MEAHMPEIRRILVPTDYSTNSRAAIEYALFLAKAHNAELELMHVWEVPAPFDPEWTIRVPGGASLGAAQYVRQRAAEEMEQLVSELKLLYARVRGRIDTGDPATAIVEAASSGSDLIVMATHGRTGVSRWVMGSVAEKVARHAKCPLTIVRGTEARHG
jgi:universal stress protein A